MNMSIGKGFGLFDFDDNGRLYSVRRETGGDEDSVMHEFLIDREMVDELSEAGVDLAQFFLSSEEDREQLLLDAGLDPDDFDFYDSYYDDDDDDDDDDEDPLGDK